MDLERGPISLHEPRKGCTGILGALVVSALVWWGMALIVVRVR